MKSLITLIATTALLSLGLIGTANADPGFPGLPPAGGCPDSLQNTCNIVNGDYCYDPFHNVDEARRPANRPVTGGSCSYWSPCGSGYNCVNRNWWGRGTCSDTKRFYNETCSHADQCKHGSVDMACYKRAGASVPQCVLDEETGGNFAQSCSCWFGSFGGWCESSACNGHDCTLSNFNSWSFHCAYNNEQSFGGSLWDYLFNGGAPDDAKNNCPF